MTTSLQAALLAMTMAMTPAAASAGVVIDAYFPRAAEAASPSTDSAMSRPFPGVIHWAMIATGAVFLGAAVYIQRRRGFDVD